MILNQEVLDLIKNRVTGALSSLKTTAKNLLVVAINEVYSMFPFGQRNQVLVASIDNTNIGKYVEPIEIGAFVTTTAELNAAKGVFVGFDVIFSGFKRFSHGAAAIENNPTSTIPYSPAETNSWNYNAGTDTINSTVNSNTLIGFASKLKYGKYTHKVTINAQNGSESFDDNDWPAILLCYAEDANQMVPNNAYGLNPASYSIDVVSPTIPKQFTLTLVRGRTSQQPYNIGQNLHYAIVYNLGQPDQKVIANGETSGVWNTETTYGTGKNCDVQVDRVTDVLNVLTTDWNDAPGGKGSLRFPLSVDLTSDPLLAIFRGSASYGYAALSQQNSYFTNVSFSPNTNSIYDLTDGNVWDANSSGTYSINSSRNYFTEIGERRTLFNPVTRKLIYMKQDKTFEVMNNSISNYVVDEVPSGTVNGTNTAFVISTTPVTGTCSVFVNGVKQVKIIDYTISGPNLTFVTAPQTAAQTGNPQDDIIEVTYYKP